MDIERNIDASLDSFQLQRNGNKGPTRSLKHYVTAPIPKPLASHKENGKKNNDR